MRGHKQTHRPQGKAIICKGGDVEKKNNIWRVRWADWGPLLRCDCKFRILRVIDVCTQNTEETKIWSGKWGLKKNENREISWGTADFKFCRWITKKHDTYIKYAGFIPKDTCNTKILRHIVKLYVCAFKIRSSHPVLSGDIDLHTQDSKWWVWFQILQKKKRTRNTLFSN